MRPTHIPAGHSRKLVVGGRRPCEAWLRHDAAMTFEFMRATEAKIAIAVSRISRVYTTPQTSWPRRASDRA